MSRDHEILDFIYNSRNHTVGEVRALDGIAYAPLGILSSPGHPTATYTTEWIANRYIPSIRPRLAEALRELGYSHPAQMMFASFGLNLSDQYWFKPEGVSLDWHELNYFENDYDDVLGRSMSRPTSGDAPGLKLFDTRSPSAGTPGILPKWWERRNGIDYLVKGSSLNNREPYNEQLSTKLYTALLDERDYVLYTLEALGEQVFSACPCFIDATTELMPMRDVMSCYAPAHRRWDYRLYVDACRSLGATDIERQLAKMLVCDFLTANPDRHDRNLGLIREVETLAIRSVAPIFDNGRAFFFAAQRPEELLDGLFFYQSTPFSEYPSAQLALVEDYSWYEPERLNGFSDTMREVLSKNPALPSEFIDAMAAQFSRRLERVNEAAREHRPLSL
jgi:hypothetical protein